MAFGKLKCAYISCDSFTKIEFWLMKYEDITQNYLPNPSAELIQEVHFNSYFEKYISLIIIYCSQKTAK